MSFSSRVKDELKQIMPEKEHCLRAEIAGILHGGLQEEYPKSLNPLLAALYAGLSSKDFDPADAEILQRPCCKKAYIRGLFLSSGTVSDPEKMYHLEMVFRTQEEAREFRSLLKLNGIPSKVIERKNRFVVYLKEGDVIVDFLALIGASASLLAFENTRVYKEVRNAVNRQVNCETANLEKTISAAISQTQAIEKIKSLNLYSLLPAPIRELAEMRLEYPESSLKELGEMMDPPVSKSGVNHRMRKLLSIAEEERL
ncbi:MAG: DNA-binding protein WhiA [Lachnospiraceae bacterium]|nr:DNA-binding protein WhiA [Lachnospiraceae bacterium]